MDLQMQLKDTVDMLSIIAEAHDIRSNIEDFMDTATEYHVFKNKLIESEADGTINQEELVNKAFLTGVYTAIRLCAQHTMKSAGYNDPEIFIDGSGIKALPIKEKNDAKTEG